MLQPEVPYDPDYASGEEENWRDPDILADDNVVRQRADAVLTHPSETSQDQMPDDCWMLPPDLQLAHVLGKGKSKLNDIRDQTKASLRYNEQKNQVDIWGDRESINSAKRMLDLIVHRIHKEKDSNRRKTKKWGKPERELTASERRRAERKQAKAAEERSYLGFPDVLLSYNAIVPIPDKDIPMVQVLGSREEFLNKIRADCKSFMRFSTATNIVQITGDNEEHVKQAAVRMRNLYIKNGRSPERTTLRLLKQPKVNMMVKFRRLPQNYITPRYATINEQQLIMANNRLLEGMTTGVVSTIIRHDLIKLDDGPGDDDTKNNSGLSEVMRNLDDRNAKEMIKALEMGLTSIRLSQHEIKMKIRFGQVVITDYPKRDGAITLEDIAYKYFPNRKFKSILAPCIGRTKEDIQPLFEWLSSNCIQFTDSPRTTYTIEAEQSPHFVTQPSPWARRGQHTAPTVQEKWRTTIIANFTNERRVGLWNLIAEGEDIVTISNADLENDYSWELNLQSAKRFNTMDDSDTPHGQFIEVLTQNAETERLRYLPNARDYQPHLITQKTKWVYALDDWIIEVCRDEVWDARRINSALNGHDLPVDLSDHNVDRAIMKFSIYRESWVNRFAENLSLQVGEAPTWDASQFLSNNNENMREIIEIAHRMTSMLSKEIKPYYESTL